MERKNTQTPKSKGSGQLFQNKILEKLTRTHISVPLIIFTAISTLLIYRGHSLLNLSVLLLTMYFIAGVLSFTLFEYIMHRYVFHMTPRTERRKKVSYTMHGVHHEYPKDKDRLAMPPPLSLTIAGVLFLLFRLLIGTAVYGFLPGFLMGYVGYLGVHYMVHAYAPPKNFFKVLWVHHSIHHFKEPERAFGVSSPLWDFIFNTMPKTKQGDTNKLR